MAPEDEARATRIVTGVALVLVAVTVAVLLLAGLPFAGGSGRAQTTAEGGLQAGVEQRIGTSAEGAPITVLRFGDEPRRLLVVADVHGDEFGGDAAKQLVSELRRDPSLRPEGVAIDVIPCLNPDGREAGTRANARGVDLNRNLPSADWSASLDAEDPSAGSHLSGGTKAGPEPETQAFLTCLDNGYAAVVSLHSSGGLIDWDGAGAERLASRVASISGLPVSHMAYQPSIHGSMGRYLTERGIPLVTVELGGPVLTGGVRDGILRCLATP